MTAVRRPAWAQRTGYRLLAHAACAATVVLGIERANGSAQEQQEKAIDAQVRAWLEQADQAEAAGDFDGVDEALKSATAALLESGRSTAAVDLRYGRFLYWNEVTDEGLALLYRASGDLPGDVEAALALTDALIHQRDAAFGRGEFNVAEASLEEARKAFASLPAGEVDSSAARLRKARLIARTAGDEPNALPIYFELLRETPDDAALHREFIQMLPAAKNFERALGFYEGLEMDHGLRLWFLGEVYVSRAHSLYNNQEDDAQALADYRTAKTLIAESARFRPEYFAAAVEYGSYYDSWLGWVMLRMEKQSEAWLAFSGALGRFPTNTSAISGLEQLGFYYYEMDLLEDARELYRQLCYWQPDVPNHWNNYGLMCRDTGHYEEGFRAYLRAMQLAPQDPRLINDSALMLQYHLDRDLDLCEHWLLEARRLAREAHQSAAEPAVEEEMRAVLGDALVNLWRLYDDQGKMEVASGMRAELAELDPQRPELGETHGG